MKNQVGCGYCIHENKCVWYDRNVNKAKLGCEEYVHHEEVNNKNLKTKTKSNEKTD